MHISNVLLTLLAATASEAAARRIRRPTTTLPKFILPRSARASASVALNLGASSTITLIGAPTTILLTTTPSTTSLADTTHIGLGPNIANGQAATVSVDPTTTAAAVDPSSSAVVAANCDVPSVVC